MKNNLKLKKFIQQHKQGKNQILYQVIKCRKYKIVENIINNLLIKKNTFIFESVEKQKIKGRYTIIVSDTDKIW